MPLSPSSTSSLTRTYTAASSQSSSSGSLPGKPTKRPTNLIQLDSRGNVGCVLGQPDPPRLVIFLAPPTDQRPQVLATASLLVVNRKFYHKVVSLSSRLLFLLTCPVNLSSRPIHPHQPHTLQLPTRPRFPRPEMQKGHPAGCQRDGDHRERGRRGLGAVLESGQRGTLSAWRGAGGGEAVEDGHVGVCECQRYVFISVYPDTAAWHGSPLTQWYKTERLGFVEYFTGLKKLFLSDWTAMDARMGISRQGISSKNTSQVIL